MIHGIILSSYLTHQTLTNPIIVPTSQSNPSSLPEIPSKFASVNNFNINRTSLSLPPVITKPRSENHPLSPSLTHLRTTYLPTYQPTQLRTYLLYLSLYVRHAAANNRRRGRIFRAHYRGTRPLWRASAAHYTLTPANRQSRALSLSLSQPLLARVLSSCFHPLSLSLCIALSAGVYTQLARG